MKNTKVLIVEDDLIIAREIEQSLKKLGYEVVESVTSGEEVLQLLQIVPVDLVLMDINIEGDKNGIEIAMIVREQHHIPVVFLTALSDQATLQNAKRAAPYGYIVKPFEEEDIKVAVEMALFKYSSDKESEIQKHKLTQTFACIEEAVIHINNKYQCELINQAALHFLGNLLDKKEEAINIGKVIDFFSLNKEKLPIYYFLNESSEVSGEEFVCYFPLIQEEHKLIIKTQRIIIDNEIVGWVLIFSAPAKNTQKNLSTSRSSSLSPSWIFAKKGKRYVKVNIMDLLWVEALDNYVVLNTSKDKFIIHSTLRKIEALLPQDDFIKIHRSFIVRLDKIEAWEDGFVVISDKLLSVSKTYQDELKERLLLL